jgi:hypothetical protein
MKKAFYLGAMLIALSVSSSHAQGALEDEGTLARALKSVKQFVLDHLVPDALPDKELQIPSQATMQRPASTASLFAYAKFDDARVDPSQLSTLTQQTLLNGLILGLNNEESVMPTSASPPLTVMQVLRDQDRHEDTAEVYAPLQQNEDHALRVSGIPYYFGGVPIMDLGRGLGRDKTDEENALLVRMSSMHSNNPHVARLGLIAAAG